jgi:Ca2+-binding RTX toxin-like protein
MSILTVGPSSTYATIADAMAVANAGDEISLEAGYSNEHALVDVDDISIMGAASSTGIKLKLDTGVATVTLLGDAPIDVRDNAGANTITGNDGANVIHVSAGGDVVHGGLGVDRLVVDYSTVTASIIGTTVSVTDGGIHSVTFDGIENVTIDTGSGNDTITAGDGRNVLSTRAGNDTITSGNGHNRIDAGLGNDTITAGDGGNHIFGAKGDDIITSGDGGDVINAGLGNDTIVAGGGNDYIFSIGGIDTVDAGPGNDRLILNYSHSTTNVNGGVGGGNLAAGYSGTIANVAGTSSTGFSFVETFTVITGSGNDTIRTGGGHDILIGNAGNDTLKGRAGTDYLKGGAGNDVLIGGRGADVLVGAAGADTFHYGHASQSTGAGHDVTKGFDTNFDRFDLKVSVTGVDTHITSGHLDSATFNHDLRAAINSSTLAANHAVLFTPDSGSNAGDLYIIVDANGVAGFQRGQDYVIEIDHGHHMNALSAGDFI